MSTWFIIAQILGAVTICFEFASYQIKDKRKYLLINGIGSAIWATMFIFVGLATSMDTMLSLVIVGFYSSIRALVFWWIFKYDTPRRRKAGKIFLYSMLTIALGAGIFVISGLPSRQVIIIQIVALVFALGFVIGQYMPGKHPVRISVSLYAIMLFMTQTPLNILEGEGIERWNIMGMLIELAKITSVLVFYVLYFKKKQTIKKLGIIKKQVANELSEINMYSDAAKLNQSGLLKLSKLEALVARMLRLEIKAIDTDEITNIGSIEKETQNVMDDLKTVHDVKMLLEKIIIAKRERLKNHPSASPVELRESKRDLIFPTAQEN